MPWGLRLRSDGIQMDPQKLSATQKEREHQLQGKCDLDGLGRAAGGEAQLPRCQGHIWNSKCSGVSLAAPGALHRHGREQRPAQWCCN